MSIVIIGSAIDLSLLRHQAMTWINAAFQLIESLPIKFSESKYKHVLERKSIWKYRLQNSWCLCGNSIHRCGNIHCAGKIVVTQVIQLMFVTQNLKLPLDIVPLYSNWMFEILRRIDIKEKQFYFCLHYINRVSIQFILSLPTMPWNHPQRCKTDWYHDNLYFRYGHANICLKFIVA